MKTLRYSQLYHSRCSISAAVYTRLNVIIKYNHVSYRCMQLAVFYLAHKGIIFLMLPLTYEGLAGMKGLISIHYIRLDMYILPLKPMKYSMLTLYGLGYNNFSGTEVQVHKQQSTTALQHYIYITHENWKTYESQRCRLCIASCPVLLRQ